MSAKDNVDELVEKHMSKINVMHGLENATRNLVKKMLTHPAFNNPKYQWSLDDFELGKRLGRGKFGRVYLGREKRTEYLVAIKTIVKKELVEASAEQTILREIEIQSHLKHPNILEMLTWFYDSHRIYIVLEYAGLGELYGHLQKSPNGRFNDKVSAKYVYQVADALEYCHKNCVIHRDIKPENLLLTIDYDVKLADFGWSVHAPSLARNTMCGTLDYLPPEMIEGQNYKQYVDNWCLGILCYEFLHGYPPFKSADTKSTYKRICTGTFEFESFISDSARDFISRLVVLDGHERMALSQVKEHPWITENK